MMIRIPGRIPICIHPLFFVLAVMIAWLNSTTVPQLLVWIVVIFFSILIHEFGHALTAVAFGQKARIDLVMLGGLTHHSGRKLRTWQDFLIVLNGPLAGFALAAVAYLFLEMRDSKDLLTYGLQVAVVINVIWTVLNLLPVQPLDGGRLLGVVLEGFFGLRGLKISLLISGIVAIGLSFFFLITQMLIAGLLFLMFAFEAFRSWREMNTMTEQDRNTTLRSALKGAERNIREGRIEEAMSGLEKIRNEAKGGLLYTKATEHLAQLLLNQGRGEEALQILKPLEKQLQPHALHLLHHLMYEAKDWPGTIAVGTRLYEDEPHYDVAVINAAAHAALGDTQAAIGWLKCAVREGLPNLNTALQRPEFNSLRNDPQFHELSQQ